MGDFLLILVKNEVLHDWTTSYEEFLDYYTDDLKRPHDEYLLTSDSNLEDYVKVLKYLTSLASESFIQWSVPKDALGKIATKQSNELIDRLLQTIHNKFTVLKVRPKVTTVSRNSSYKLTRLFFN